MTDSNTKNDSDFITIYDFVYPIPAYILKTRLETDGFSVFVFNDINVWIHPLYSQAYQGIQLKIPSWEEEQFIDYLEKSEFYNWDIQLEAAYYQSCKEMEFKSVIRSNQSILDEEEKLIHLKNEFNLTDSQFEELIINEHKFRQDSKITWMFKTKEFVTSLVAPEIDFWKYLRIKGNDFFLEKDEVERFDRLNNESDSTEYCPFCHSTNIYHGPRINPHWNILSLIFSLILVYPIPHFNLGYHCFECHEEFEFH